MGKNELMMKLHIYIMFFCHRDNLFRLYTSVELAMIDMYMSCLLRVDVSRPTFGLFLSCSTVRTTNLRDYCTYMAAICVYFHFLDP